MPRKLPEGGYNEDKHFESYARRDGDSRTLARLKQRYGPSGGHDAPPPPLTEGDSAGPAGDENVDDAGDGRPTDESGPHPDGCRCPACKEWMATKGAAHESKGAMLSPEDVDAIMG